MKIISIEEVNVLVQFAIGGEGVYGFGNVLGEADTKIRILTDDGIVVTRYIIGGEQHLEDCTLKEIVDNPDNVRRVDDPENYPTEGAVKEWIMNECFNDEPFGAITYVVSALSRHGMWKSCMSKWVKEIYEEMNKSK